MLKTEVSKTTINSKTVIGGRCTCTQSAMLYVVSLSLSIGNEKHHGKMLMAGQTYYHIAIQKPLLFPESHIWDTVSRIHTTVIVQTATGTLSCHWHPCTWKISETIYYCANSTTTLLHLTSSLSEEKVLITNLPTLTPSHAYQLPPWEVAYCTQQCIFHEAGRKSQTWSE